MNKLAAIRAARDRAAGKKKTPAKKPPKVIKPPTGGGTISTPNGVAPGYGVAYDANGKPISLGALNQQSAHSSVGLADGVGVQYDANGKPIGFVNVNQTTGAVKGPYGETPAAAPAAAAPAPIVVPPIQPFFSADDLLTSANFWTQWNGTFAALDKQLADLVTDTELKRGDLVRSRDQSLANTDDNAAARGVQRSSIRDGERASTTAEAGRADKQLTDNVTSATADVEKQKTDFQTNVLPTFNAAQSQSAVENAAAANSVVREAQAATPATEPAPAAAPAPAGAPAAKPPEPAAPPKGVVKNGKFYHYYKGPPERWVYIRPATNGSQNG